MGGQRPSSREAVPNGWSDTFEQLSAADVERPLDLGELESLAVAAYLIGRDDDAVVVWTRAHQVAQRSGEPIRAVRSAFWLAFSLLNRGELAQGGGWVERARRLLDGAAADCVERGYVRYAAALRAIFEGDAAVAVEAFTDAVAVGQRFGDAELVCLARVGEGRCRIYRGDVPGGVALLDEAMVSVVAGEVSPVAVGDVYCTVIDACQELFDLGRVREWTAALSDWCESQPDLVLYRGQCMIHRAEIMQLRGDWREAVEEIDRARARLTDPPGQLAIGAAFYVRADLHRVQGEFAEAERAYHEASVHGRDPQPGLALLRLAQGRVDVARAALERVLGAAESPLARARLLPASVDVCLAAGDVSAARVAAEELNACAAELDALYLRAWSATATGAVALAAGDAATAATALRDACGFWRDVHAPYELARAQVLMALACRELGDTDTETMEAEAARRVFEELGAAADLAQQHPTRVSAPAPTDDLTGREVEVIRLIASGKTNRAIAAELNISEKTVARHVSNIFTKLGLANRSAATAYAYEHGLAGDRAV